MQIRSAVAATAPATAPQAIDHFRARLSYEADASDVAADLAAGLTGFVLVDCRSPELYAEAHLPGAINLPHRRITADVVDDLIPDESTLIVTYCAGPHCNASTKGALRFAGLGRPVKEMPGGIDGWRRENLPIEHFAAVGH
jgi:rhodanese-related sulfurtransferase